MNGLATLPGIPESALDGQPPPEDLPTPALRRRYAQALACALAGEKSNELAVWRSEDLPYFLQLRAMQEGWPVVGVPKVLTIIQPALSPAPRRADPAGHRAGARRPSARGGRAAGVPLGGRAAADAFGRSADAYRGRDVEGWDGRA